MRTFILLILIGCVPLFGQISGTFSPVGNDKLFVEGWGLAEDPQGVLYTGGCETLHQFNGTEWDKIHSVFDGPVDGLTFDPAGNLIVSGEFQTVDGMPANRTALWDGNAWTAMGNGIDEFGGAQLFDYDAAGNLYAAAYGGLVVMKWDGVNWDTVGGDLQINILSMVVSDQGDIYVGAGDTRSAATTNVLNHWNGSSWNTMIDYSGAFIEGVALDSQGNLYIGGNIPEIDGLVVDNIARWDGTTWSSVGGGCSCGIFDIEIDSQDQLYVGGSMNDIGTGNTIVNNIAKWDGNSWMPLDNGTSGRVNDILISNQGGLYTTGGFYQSSGVLTMAIARWDNSSWHAVGKSFLEDGVYRVETDDQGNIYVGGAFIAPSDSLVAGFGRWNGNEWSDLGANIWGTISSLAVHAQDQIYIGGYFFLNDSIFPNYIAQWNGVSWDSLGPGLEGSPYDMVTDENGVLYITGEYDGLKQWDGTSWSDIGSNFVGEFSDLAIDQQNHLLGIGAFSFNGDPFIYGVAKWDGTNWIQVGDAMDAIGDGSIVVSPSGEIYITGNFELIGTDSVRHVAKWDGSNWEQIGGGLERAGSSILVDAADFVYVGGWRMQVQGPDPHGLAIWDGTNWNKPDPSFSHACDRFPSVDDMALAPNGSVLMVGDFTFPYPYITRWDGGNIDRIEPGVKISVSIFPNPSAGILQIESPEARIHSIKLFDLTGRDIQASVKQEHLNATIQSTFRGLAFIQLKTDKGLITRQIIFY